MSGRVQLGSTQQDAISLSSDSDVVSVAISTDSDELPTLDDITSGRYRPKGFETPNRYASQRAGPSSTMSRLTQPPSTTTKSNRLPSSSVNKPSSASKGKRRMILDETLINGKDYTPPTKQRRKTPKLIDGQSKLSQFITRDPPTSSAGPSRYSKVISKGPVKGSSRANAIDLDPTSSDDDFPVIATPRKRQVSRQPSRPPRPPPPPPTSASRRLFTRGRSATSFSDAPVELPSLPKGKSKSGADDDDGLLDWLRVSPSLSPSLSPPAPSSSRPRLGVSQSPSKLLKSSTPVFLKSSQPDRNAGVIAQHPKDSQRARSVTRLSPATPQRRTRNTFLPPPKISASGSLELVPETPPRPTDLLASLARTPTPSPVKPRTDTFPAKSRIDPSPAKSQIDPSPVKSKELSASPKADAVAPAMKRRRAAFEELDEESYRPSPNTKLGREVRQRKKREVSMPADPPSTGRPRRVAAVPGKYRLPTMDTPIHQWPTTRASPSSTKRRQPRKPTSPSKLRNAVAADSGEEEADTPRRSGRRTVARKTVTPRSAQKKISKRTPSKRTPSKPASSKRTPAKARPAPPSPSSSSESSLSTPPVEDMDLPPPLQTPSPEASLSPTPSPPPIAQQEEDLLAEFAEYADWPQSPSHSQQTAQSPRTGLLRTPSRSSVGRASASPLAKHPSLSPFASQRPQLPFSQASQKSLTTRILEDAKAEKEAREKAAEEYARLLEERTAERLAERAAATPSDSEEEELHLSQVLQNQASQRSQPERRSRRIQVHQEGKAQQHIIAAAQALTEEELAADRQMKILHRRGKKKIDHDAFFRAADMAARLDQGGNVEGNGCGLDLSFLDGEDRDAIADCTGTQDDPGDAAKRRERDAELSRPTFWNFDPWAEQESSSPVSLPPAPFAWPQLDCTDEQEVYDILMSGVVRELAREDEAAVRWLCEVALASDQDDLTTLANADAISALRSWKVDPSCQCNIGLLEIANGAWDELGAAECAGTSALRIGQTRETATTVICQVARALSSRDFLPGTEAVGLIRRLAVLAVDPSTSPALCSEISETIEKLTSRIEASDSWGLLFSALTEDLAKLPLALQARAICMFGLGSESVCVMVRWTALSLLLRSADHADDVGQRWERYPDMSDLHSGMDLIMSGLRGLEPDYYRLLDQLSLWSAAAGDIYVLVQRWWEEKLRRSEELEAEQAEESLGLGQSPEETRIPETPLGHEASRGSSLSLHDESRASSALTKVKMERPSPGFMDCENENPVSLFYALKYAANKVRDEPGTSPLLKSRLNQLAQCIHQNVVAETKLLEAAKADKIYERGYLEQGVGGQTRLSFGGVGVKVEPSSEE